jgi:hypothetical protein
VCLAIIKGGGGRREFCRVRVGFDHSIRAEDGKEAREEKRKSKKKNKLPQVE